MCKLAVSTRACALCRVIIIWRGSGGACARPGYTHPVLVAEAVTAGGVTTPAINVGPVLAQHLGIANVSETLGHYTTKKKA